MARILDLMTTEILRKKFGSTFALVNYSIDLTHNIIESGRRTKAVTKYDNPAIIALEEILEGVDEIIPIEMEDEGAALKEAREAMAKKGLELVKANITKKKK